MAAVLGHTGALVSDADAFGAFLERHGVTEVRELDELVETLALFGSGVRSNGKGLVFVGTSGGKAAHYADLCEEIGLQLASISNATHRELSQIVGPAYKGTNPIDAGLGGVTPEKLRGALEVLAADENVGLVCLWGDFPVDDHLFAAYSEYVARAVREAEDVADDAGASLVSSIHGAARSGKRGRVSRIPILNGASEVVRAFRHLVEWERESQAWVGDPVDESPAEVPTGVDIRRLAHQTWVKAGTMALGC